MRWPLKPKAMSLYSPVNYRTPKILLLYRRCQGRITLLAFQTFGVAWVQEKPPPPRYYLPCSFFPNTNDFAYLLQRHP